MITVEELAKERLKAKNLCYEYNLLRPNELDKKKEILKALVKAGHEVVAADLRETAVDGCEGK